MLIRQTKGYFENALYRLLREAIFVLKQNL